ncbi:MAG: hypothetical protein KDE58_31995, partial [Caldilineaceae bacterium]|nr:hypothetical protein [Caldilineaceae bacterium]
VWRYGVILRDNFARAEVLELRGERQIRIRVSGGNKRDLLMEIVRALDELHEGFPKLQFERQIPCNCDTCRQRTRQQTDPHFFALHILQERLADANAKDTIECRYKPYHDVPIHGLLSELSLWQRGSTKHGGHTYIVDRLYQGEYHEGDRYGGGRVEGDLINVGDISTSTGISIGKEIESTVTRNVGKAQTEPATLNAAEEAELEELIKLKTVIEAPLHLRARLVKYSYVLLYIGLILLVGFGLHRLVESQTWDKLEPFTWIISTILGLAGPLIVWLSAENLKPGAIERRVFEYWRNRHFEKIGFHIERYEQLIARKHVDLHYHYHSDGGAIIGGNAEIGGDFLGRDRYGA